MSHNFETEDARIAAAKVAGRNVAAHEIKSGYTTLRNWDKDGEHNARAFSHLAAVGFSRLGTRTYSQVFVDAYKVEFIRLRLEYLRGEIEAERISGYEIAELAGYAEYIDSADTLLLGWAGVPEHPEDDAEPNWTREQLNAVIEKHFPNRLLTFYTEAMENNNEVAAVEDADGRMYRVWADGDSQPYNP